MKNEENMKRGMEINEEMLDRVTGGTDDRLMGEEKQPETEGKIEDAFKGIVKLFIPIPAWP